MGDEHVGSRRPDGFFECVSLDRPLEGMNWRIRKRSSASVISSKRVRVQRPRGVVRQRLGPASSRSRVIASHQSSAFRV